MKRKEAPVVQESPAKASRQSPSQEEDETPWEKKAGMIMEVKLRNFMCHEVRLNLRMI